MKSKSLTFRIFANTFLVGALVYLICAILFVSNMYSYFEKQIFQELETEASFIEEDANEGRIDKLSKLKTKNRITLIHRDGSVFYDNTVDCTKMENHGNRQEFLGAVEKGKVTTSRYSSTMLEKTLYFAKLLDSDNVLRISCNQHSVAVLVLGMSESLILMLVLAVIISAIAASLISKKIVEPFNKIALNDPEKTQVYNELKPFLKRIAEENYEKSQREELRQQFSANVSHELKTPLTSISGYAEILKNGGVDEETTKEFASTIYKECQIMITLVQDIIKLSKLDEQSISEEKEELSLRNITKNVFSVLEASAKTKEVTLNLYGDSGKIQGVSSVIYEMVYNLVDNGIKYNKQKGSVDVTIESMQKCVMFTVKDTGIGIPEEEHDRIFERFYRVDKSRSKALGGTGLGLSIVKHAAKYHNATILLDSEEGKGSTFTVIFKL